MGEKLRIEYKIIRGVGPVAQDSYRSGDNGEVVALDPVTAEQIARDMGYETELVKTEEKVV